MIGANGREGERVGERDDESEDCREDGPGRVLRRTFVIAYDMPRTARNSELSY